MPARQTAAAPTAPKGNQAHHQTQPSAKSATPAKQSNDQRREVPRLPSKVTVNVAKRHACHAKWRSMSSSPTPATQSDGRCREVPRKVTVDVAKCHACHAKWRPMSRSATPATQSDGGCREVPRLPCKVTVDVVKPDACHANSGGTHGAKREPSAPPDPAQSTPKVTIHVVKCHACHAKWWSMSSSQTPATQTAAPTAPNGNQAHH